MIGGVGSFLTLLLLALFPQPLGGLRDTLALHGELHEPCHGQARDPEQARARRRRRGFRHVVRDDLKCWE